MIGELESDFIPFKAILFLLNDKPISPKSLNSYCLIDYVDYIGSIGYDIAKYGKLVFKN